MVSDNRNYGQYGNGNDDKDDVHGVEDVQGYENDNSEVMMKMINQYDNNKAVDDGHVDHVVIDDDDDDGGVHVIDSGDDDMIDHDNA